MHKVGDVLFAIVVVAAIMVATRKGSQTAKVISALGGSFANAIGAATGGGGRAGVRR
jgi:hypothetical protein